MMKGLAGLFMHMIEYKLIARRRQWDTTATTTAVYNRMMPTNYECIMSLEFDRLIKNGRRSP